MERGGCGDGGDAGRERRRDAPAGQSRPLEPGRWASNSVFSARSEQPERGWSGAPASRGSHEAGQQEVGAAVVARPVAALHLQRAVEPDAVAQRGVDALRLGRALRRLRALALLAARRAEALQPERLVRRVVVHLRVLGVGCTVRGEPLRLPRGLGRRVEGPQLPAGVAVEAVLHGPERRLAGARADRPLPAALDGQRGLGHLALARVGGAPRRRVEQAVQQGENSPNGREEQVHHQGEHCLPEGQRF